MTEPQLDRDRFRGALVGLAVGDAVGTTVEFKPAGSFKPVTDMVGGGPFNLPAGAWTDDTSMALCLGDSLVERGGFDPVDQLERYVRWYREGHLSSTGTCFDIGNATRTALHRFEKTGEPFPGDADPDAAGNGPLMKLAPVALAYARHPTDAVLRAAESARTTHGAPQAIDATRYFAGLLVGALTGANVSQLLHQGPFEPAPGIWDEQPLHPEVAAVAAGSFMAKEPPAIQGAGYIVKALEAALWALMETRTFQDGVLLAVNLGDDADTTAAIYGQLAGALYGVDAIPPQWRAKLVMGDRIEALADELFALAARIDPASRPRPPQAQPRPSPQQPPAPGDSYWVLDGQLLAGPYPGAPTKAEAAAKLDAFLDAGVTCFVDLTEDGERPPLHPYSTLLRQLAHKRKTRVTHLRLPIRDVDIPTSWQMRAILCAIRLAVAEGETVYVHCGGGVGRTGTVVGCLLVEHGVAPGEVLGRLAHLRRDTQRVHRVSPETDTQRAFIEHWTAQDTLVLDQRAIDRLGITVAPSDRSPVPTFGELVATLGNGAPAVIEGPEPGWCVEAVAHDDGLSVRVEVLDPEHWKSGRALPSEQQRVLEQLGFRREPSAWVQTEHDEDGVSALNRSAKLMLAVADQAWGLEAKGALQLDDVPTPDAPWDRITEFAHTFNGYAHFGESWGARVSAVRERYFETGELPDDVDELRGCLFCEFRADRFTWGDDVTISAPDADGVRRIVGNPDFDSSPTQGYRRAVIARIRELLG